MTIIMLSLAVLALIASVLAVTVYVILDLEYPRVGLIRISAADHFLVDLLAGMK